MAVAHSQTTETFLSRYDYTAEFFPENWAWEFLRRNEDFKAKAIAKLQQSPSYADTPCGAPIASLKSKCPQAEAWGLMYFPDPRRNCLQTNVFWSPAHYPRKLQVNVVPRSPDTIDVLKEKSLKHCKVFYLSDDNDNEHLVVRGNTCAVQVSCIGLSLLSEAPVEMQVRAAGFTHPQGVASWLARLNRMLSSEPKRPKEWNAQNTRLRNTLVSLDAYIAGLSLYQTACHIFGQEETDTSWASGSRAMKDKVRRLRQKGMGLRDGGYRDLLA